MKFGSVCSGIEAASVAWEPLGWSAAWLSEIEPFPCAVLAHHWPEVPNLGDMTQIKRRIRSHEIEAPEVFTGGTPCQAFSVAGKRGSLDDARGNLTLEFVEIANAIDDVRQQRDEPETIIMWENVPGVLNTKDNAFGCFLAALAGEDSELQPAGKKWTNAGCVYGPKRAIAWRVIDAQYFGVAQRRRRVFVVASAREGFDPAAVLFESEGVRRDSAPSREAGQETSRDIGCGFETAGTLDARTKGGGFPGSDGACSGHVVVSAFGGNNQSGPIDVATARNACGSGSGRLDFESETFLVHGFQPRIGRNGRGDMGELCHALAAQAGETGKGDAALCVAVVHGTQDPCVSDKAFALGRNHGQESVVGTIAAHSFTGGMGGRPDAAATGHVQITPEMDVRRLTPIECERLQDFPDNHTLIPVKAAKKIEADYLTYLKASMPDLTEDQAKRMAKDGPRYKAIGNSWAVPCARWIGIRIQQHLMSIEAAA